MFLYEGEERIFESNLFHSAMVDEKVFLKELWLALTEGLRRELRLENKVDSFGIRWWRYDGDSFFIIL